LFDHENVVLTPHLMGFTRQGMAHTVRDAAQGAVDVLAGRTPAAVAAP
jgi:phosphoglycerate dehydrogenase-like enzyme